MKYQIIGKNITITEGINDAVVKKLSKLDKYFLVEPTTECRVVASVHGTSQKVEITVFLPQFTLRAEVSDKDLYAAIDLAIDKLLGQMRKVKTKVQNSKKKQSFADSLPFDNIESEPINDEKDVVVRAKSYNLTPMKIDEAIIRMEALGHDFFVYLDKDDDLISVVYNRREGGYGVIQAENPLK